MTQKIRYAKSGDRLSASYLNRIVEGANLALDLLGPARSQRLPSADSYNPTLDADGNGTIDGLGTTVYYELQRRTSNVRISDLETGAYVDVARIDEVTMYAADGSVVTFVFNNA